MIQNIIDGFKKLLKSDIYDVIDSYDQSEEVNGNGMMRIQIDQLELVQQNLNDYFIDLTIEGQTFIDDDLDKKKLLDMFKFSQSKLTQVTPQQFSSLSSENVVGILRNGSNIFDNESVHSFEIKIRLAVCDFSI